MDYIEFLTYKKELEEKAITIAKRMYELYPHHIDNITSNTYYYSNKQIEFFNDSIYIKWDYTRSGCGDTDYYEITVPIEYIDNDKWEELFTLKMDVKLAKDKAEMERRESDRIAKQLEIKRKQYEELKKQFENEV